MGDASRIIYSIVVPVYNVELYLSECIESVLAQDTQSKYEILLIDDGSTDRSGTICDDYAEKQSNIRVFHTKNQGVSCARNIGIESSSGRYLLFLDSDDLLAPNTLSTLDVFLEKDPDMVVFCMQTFDETGRLSVNRPGLFPKEGETGEQYLQRYLSAGERLMTTACSWLCSVDFLRHHEIRFPPGLVSSEDLDFVMQSVPLADVIFGTDHIGYLYRQRAGSVCHTPSVKVRGIVAEIVVKWFRRFPSASIANYYLGLVLTSSSLGDRRALRQIICYFEKNKDILNYVTGFQRKVACTLIRLVGFYNASVIFLPLIKIRNHRRGLR